MSTRDGEVSHGPGVSGPVCRRASGARWRIIPGDILALGGRGFGPPPLRVAGLTSRRSNATGGSVSKQLTVDCHLGTVGVEGQHPSHFGGLSRRRLVAPDDAVMDLSVDVERPI